MKKALKIIAWALGVFFAVVTLVYVFYQFETFSPDQPSLTYYQAIWITLLNPTGLTGSGFTFPQTIVGKLIGIVFVLISISLFGVFIGKISDMFTEYREYRKLGHHGTDFEDHYVIIGWDNIARLVTEQLVLSDQDVVIVTNQKEHIDIIYDEFERDSVFVLFSSLNNYENLKKANMQNCHRLLINNPSDTETLVNLLNIKANDDFSNVDSLVTIQEERMRNTFIGQPEQNVPENTSGRPDKKERAYWAYSLYRPASNLIASTIFEPLSADFLGDLITSVNNDNDNDEEYELQLYEITEGDAFYDQNTDFEYAFNYIYFDGDLGRDYEYQCMPLGLSKRLQNGGNRSADRNLQILPDPETPVEPGDYLIVIAKGTWMDKLQEDFDSPQGLHPEDTGKVDWTRLSLLESGDETGGDLTAQGKSGLTTEEEPFTNHIVIIGWGKVTRIVVRRLLASNQQVVVVTEEKGNIETINELYPGNNTRAAYRNLASYGPLDDDQVNITASKRVFVNLPTDEECLVATMNLDEKFGVTPSEHDDNLNIVVAITNNDLEQSFVAAGVTYTASHDVINAKLIASYLYEEDVAFCAEDLLAGTENDHDRDLQQYQINGASSCRGRTYLEALEEIKTKFNSLVIGLAKEDEDHKLEKLPKNPDQKTIEEGDYLLLIVAGESEERLQEYMGGGEGH